MLVCISACFCACSKHETQGKSVSLHDHAALIVLLCRPVKGLALHTELVTLFDQVVELLAPGKYLLDRVVQHLFSRCTFHGQKTRRMRLSEGTSCSWRDGAGKERSNRVGV